MAIILGSTSAGTLGTITMGELKSIVEAEGGYDTDTTGEQTLIIRDALRRLYGMRRWKFLSQENTAFQATVANNGIVDFSTVGRGLMIDSVRLADIGELEPADLDDVLYYRNMDSAAGLPANWAKQGDKLVLYPIPDQTYNLKILMYGYTTLPTADGDSILWPEAHISVLKFSVMLALARRQRDDATYDRAKLDLTDAMAELLRDEGVDQRQVADTVQSWTGWNRLGF